MTQWNNWWIDYDRNGSFVCVYERKKKKKKKRCFSTMSVLVSTLFTRCFIWWEEELQMYVPVYIYLLTCVLILDGIRSHTTIGVRVIWHPTQPPSPIQHCLLQSTRAPDYMYYVLITFCLYHCIFQPTWYHHCVWLPW